MADARKRVLLVDDDSTILAVVRAILEQAGFEVHATSDSTQASQLAVALEPHLIILDLGMPFMDGFDIASQIRIGTSSPIMFLSAEPALRHLKQVQDLGAAGYLEKPFTKEMLLALVREVIPA
jgi:DNA-binding response OmpR family regulator